MFAFVIVVFGIVSSNDKAVRSCQSLYGVVGIVSRSWIRVGDLDRQRHDLPGFRFNLGLALDLVVSYSITLVIVYNDVANVIKDRLLR